MSNTEALPQFLEIFKYLISLNISYLEKNLLTEMWRVAKILLRKNRPSIGLDKENRSNKTFNYTVVLNHSCRIKGGYGQTRNLNVKRTN